MFFVDFILFLSIFLKHFHIGGPRSLEISMYKSFEATKNIADLEVLKNILQLMKQSKFIISKLVEKEIRTISVYYCIGEPQNMIKIFLNKIKEAQEKNFFKEVGLLKS